MVNFQIVSDLHLETYSEDEIPDFLDLVTPSAENLILAGDICRIEKIEVLDKFLNDACTLFKRVIYVLGNYEFYAEFEEWKRAISKGEVAGIEYIDLLITIENLEKKYHNLHVLNGTSVIIEDVCIAGCTLWSHHIGRLNPYKVRINMNGVPIDNKNYLSFHRRDLSFLEEAIGYSQKNKLKLMVITHYAPSEKCSIGKNRENSSLYYNNLDYLLFSKKVHTWVYGHVHINKDFFSQGGTRLVSNQKGRKGENARGFLKSKIINI